MKESSLFLVKNSFGAKMKTGFKNFCNGESSTSTLDHLGAARSTSTCTAAQPPQPPPLIRETTTSHHHQPTLEEMILQLEMEEKLTARRKNVEDHHHHHRMSCVNSSDILRSARNALNQYPRFSLDGKDSLYRSTFTTLDPIRSDGRQKVQAQQYCARKRLPDVVGGESVIWCKPGVVGRLMGLEAMPIPLNSSYRRERLSAIIKRQNLRKRAQNMAMNHEANHVAARRSSCSRRSGYCVMKPVEMEICSGEAGWPMRRRFV